MQNNDTLNETTHSIPQQASIVINGKDEMNLAEFPIARLGRNDTRLTIEYNGRIIDKTGGVLEQKWIVSGSAQFGLPTEFSERVLVGLMTITAREKFESRKVPFTIYRILKLLGLTHNKRNYSAVEKALHQLVGVTIYSEGAFWDKVQNKRVTSKKGFHLVEEFWLKSFETDAEVIESEGANGYIVWGERIWDSFKAGYIKNLNIDFYYSLKNTIARRLYRFLDKRMHYQDTYQIDIFDLAGRLGMKRYRYPSDIARKMEPAFSELQDRGYLVRVDIIKVGKFTRVKFYKMRNAEVIQNSFLEETETASQPHRGVKTVVDASTPSDPFKKHLDSLYEFHNTPEELKQVWNNVLADLKATLNSVTFNLVAQTALVDIDGSEAIVAINERSRDWVELQFSRRIKQSLNIFLEQNITDVSFILIPT